MAGYYAIKMAHSTSVAAKRTSKGAKGGGRRSQDANIRLSKRLSWLLRHGATQEGFSFSDGGFLNVDDILRREDFRGWTVNDVKDVVENNDKIRFALRSCPDSGKLQIRANQGHSIPVDDLDLSPVFQAADVPVVIHGTYERKWDIIKTKGLSCMKRNHIHFAAAEPDSEEIISGFRGSCDVFIYINLEKALQDGLKFFVSANQVILSPGDENGVILPKYFMKVQHGRVQQE